MPGSHTINYKGICFLKPNHKNENHYEKKKVLFLGESKIGPSNTILNRPYSPPLATKYPL